MSEQIETIQVTFAPIDDVEPNPFNPNVMPEEKQEELKRLMAATDARTFFKSNPLSASPYEVFWGKKLVPQHKGAPYVFIDGANRWLFAKELKWTEVGLHIRNVTLSQARQECYSKNYLRGDIDPIKEALLFQDELNDGLNQTQIADKYFKTPTYISKSLSLLTLPQEIISFLYFEEDALTKTHLEHLIGLPEEEALDLAGRASRGEWSAKRLQERTDEAKERIEFEARKQEALSHFTLRECPICGASGMIEAGLKRMHCSAHYGHYELELRTLFSWGPLDTREGLLKKKFKLDDGSELPLEEIITRKKKGTNGKEKTRKKPDWFKYEKTLDELMPRFRNFAYEMLVAHRAETQISNISIYGTTKEGKPFHIDSGSSNLWIEIDDKELTIYLESKEWKRGNFKTRVNVRGVQDEIQLKPVQEFLDRLMAGTAKVEDFPFHVRTQRTVREEDTET